MLTPWLQKGRAPPSGLHRMGCLCVLWLYWCSLTWAASISLVESANQPIQLYWNRSNPLFTSASPPVIDVQMKDTISIWCPDNTTAGSQPEYYVIYRVPESYFDSCSVPPGTAEDLLNYSIIRIINCSRFTSVLRPQLYITDYPISGPLQLGLAWVAGMTYYLMTPSTGDFSGLGNLQGEQSGCNRFNMKLVIRVANSSLTPATSAQPAVPTGSSSSSASVTTSASPPSRTTAKLTTAAAPPSSTSPTTDSKRTTLASPGQSAAAAANSSYASSAAPAFRRSLVAIASAAAAVLLQRALLARRPGSVYGCSGLR